MFCPNCGTEIQKDALFCGNCGFKVEDFVISTEPAQPAEPEKPAQPAQPNMMGFMTSEPAPAAAPTQPAAPAFQNTQPAVQPAPNYNQNAGQYYNPAQDQQFAAIDDNSTLITITKIFLIIGCVAQGWLIIPLAWCIPMTVSIFKSFKLGRPIGMGMKVCTLLFVNLVSGICLLCMKDHNR